MRATSVVTVLLPLVPVMPTTGACAARANSSMSPDDLEAAPPRGVEERLRERHARGYHHAQRILEQRRIEAAEAHRDGGVETRELRQLRRRGRVSVTARRQPCACR